MERLLNLGILIVFWIISQYTVYTVYIFLYYRYEIGKEEKCRIIYRNSKFTCYVMGLIISICIMMLFFENNDMTKLLKNVIVSRNVDIEQFVVLFFFNIMILIVIFLAESLLGAVKNINIKECKKIEIERRNISRLDCVEPYYGGIYIYE